MGSKMSKAKRACVTESSVTANGSVLNGGSVEYSRKIDTACVQNLMTK